MQKLKFETRIDGKNLDGALQKVYAILVNSINEMQDEISELKAQIEICHASKTRKK